MFGPPGHAYVYLIYGMHECLNAVTEPDGEAGAVLIRALEPTVGVDLMRSRRGRAADPDHRLAAGPARLCQALGVGRAFDGADLTGGSPLVIEHPGEEAVARARAPGTVAGPRIGVAYAGDAALVPWRFGIRGHPSLSRPFADGV
jgi:DNA-3-methyladenine glycosylase